MNAWFLMIVAALVSMWALGRAYDAEFASGQPQPAHVRLGDGSLIRALRAERIRTWRCQNQLSRPRTPTSYAAERSRSIAFRKWAHRLWASRADHHCAVASQVGNVSSWLCIHRYEGATRGLTRRDCATSGRRCPSPVRRRPHASPLRTV